MCSVKTYRVIIDYPYVLGRVDRLNKIHIFMPIKKTAHRKNAVSSSEWYDYSFGFMRSLHSIPHVDSFLMLTLVPEYMGKKEKICTWNPLDYVAVWSKCHLG